jgi:hypothetical protein
MWDLWCTKWHWGWFSPSTSGSLVNSRYIKYSITSLIILQPDAIISTLRASRNVYLKDITHQVWKFRSWRFVVPWCTERPITKCARYHLVERTTTRTQILCCAEYARKMPLLYEMLQLHTLHSTVFPNGCEPPVSSASAGVAGCTSMFLLPHFYNFLPFPDFITFAFEHHSRMASTPI